ncbi:MAG: tetratricopeptide (TPR) repeat protein [Psychroserpens sp.]|jgi:tetratricopeptide (TPR) repeat protein
MEKILKKYTTIPPHLYVDRKADKQLESIIHDMQRPGYVLVARQMGKTNLLFNAKRTMETENRFFGYVDMSNVFRKERECYQNIIDFIIEPNEKFLSDEVEEKIIVLREKKLPPHKEYTKSLRIILNDFPGDIVIILDEIDALKTAEYSDNIFAQIRSNYFARTNFPEFERLTYVLSGVIDPIELIKDRNKSPFNIGDKIYLDDFSKVEHESFIVKSKLNIGNEVSGEIYQWTNGNPRLTFDICSDIESLIAEGIKFSNDDLSLLIKKKYLTTYDVAPIDHIRELVKSSKDVRSALLKVHRDQSADLSDEIKNKLYLYGIIDSRFDKETKIKNQILNLSISEDWINSIDKQAMNQLNFGLEMMELNNFDQAINALNYYVIDSNPTKDQLEICNYNLGFAYYHKQNYKKAIEYFSSEFEMELYNINSQSLLGISMIGVGDTEQGIEILEGIIKAKRNDFGYINALLYLAPLLSDKTRVKGLYADLYQCTFECSDDTSEAELNKTRVLAQFNICEFHIGNGANREAIACIDLILEYSDLADSLYPKLIKYNLEEEKNAQIKRDIVDSIINENIKFETKNIHPMSFCEEHLIFYLESVFDADNTELFESLLNYAESELYQNKVDKNELAFTSSKYSRKGEDIQKYILGSEQELSNDLNLEIYRNLASRYTDRAKDYLIYFNKYKEFFDLSEKIVIEDIRLFSFAIKFNSAINKDEIALELCGSIKLRASDCEDENFKFELVIIHFWSAVLNSKLKNEEDAIYYADKTMQQIETSKDQKLTLIDEQGLEIITDQMKAIKESYVVNTPFVREIKYGRNSQVTVKYANGTIKKDKFKKLEKDIAGKKCEVV